MFLILVSALGLVVVAAVFLGFAVHAERLKKVRGAASKLGLTLDDAQVRSTADLTRNLTRLARLSEGALREAPAPDLDAKALEAWSVEEPVVLGFACSWAILRFGLYEAPYDQLLFTLFRHDYLSRRYGEENAERAVRYYFEATDRPDPARFGRETSPPALVGLAFMQRTGIDDARLLGPLTSRFERQVAMNREVQVKLRTVLPALSPFFAGDAAVDRTA